jgi:hypothetical protein
VPKPQSDSNTLPDPSAPLENHAHEGYCVSRALEGCESPDAYLRHFKTKNRATARRNAWRLSRRPEIAARIDWLKRDRVERRMKEVVVSNKWVTDELVRQYMLCDAEGDRRSAAQFLKMLAIEQGMLVVRREVIHGKMEQLQGSWEEIQSALAARIARLFPGRRPEEIIELLRANRAGRGLEGAGAAGVPPVRPIPETVDVSPARGETPRALPDGGESGGQDPRRRNGDGVPPDGPLP